MDENMQAEAEDGRARDTVDSGGAERKYHAGFVAVVGRPNVGKSTLINRLVGQKVAITSSKPQTTRVNQLAILTLDNAQMVFVDTPGIHQPGHALGERMVREARESLEDADVVLCLMDAGNLPHEEDRIAVDAATKRSQAPKILGLNKSDLVTRHILRQSLDAYAGLTQWDGIAVFSAITGEGVDDLLEILLGKLPENAPFYAEDEVTQTNARDIAGELIREQVLRHTHEEVPHSVAVVVEDYKEREDGHLYISATVYVERDSQKGIVIGKGAAMLKNIGTAARKEIETMADAPVFLDLHVKVRKDWRKKDPSLGQMGQGS